MDSSPKLYEEKFVAFIDILGFSNIVRSFQNKPKNHDKIHSALLKLIEYKNSSKSHNLAQSNLEISTFSDSIVISASKADFFSLIWTCGWLQANLLKIGILIRGGISQGLIYHQEDIIYGEGMLDAYEIESRAAVYPRIVISPKIISKLNQRIKDDFIQEDIDGLWFVDSFKFEDFIGNDELAADGYNLRELYFLELENHIKKGISDSDSINHLSKWKWLQNKFDLAFKEFKNQN